MSDARARRAPRRRARRVAPGLVGQALRGFRDEPLLATMAAAILAASLTVTNAIRVVGVNGATNTILRRTGGSDYSALSIDHANSVMMGFTIANGRKPGGAGGVNLQRGYLVNSIIVSNTGAGVVMGDAAAARVANLVVVRNTEEGIEGVGSVVNCTVAYNGGAQVGGSVVYNCVVLGAVASPVVNYTLASSAYAGTGNQAGDPLFVDAAANDFHLQTNSPALNAGHAGYNTLPTDVDGNPRVLSSIDMGAYEQDVQQGLAVALGDDPDPVPRGDRITWIVTALNAGPGTALNVAVNLPSPSGVTMLSNSAPGSYVGGVWNIGSLPAGERAELRLWAVAAQPGWYTNVAAISSVNLTSEPGYGVASNVTEILGPVTITNVVATSSSGTNVVEWESVVGIG